jgi:hypothetical protein
VTFGCMNVDETEADVGGGLKVNGETNFMGDVKVGRGWGGGGEGAPKRVPQGVGAVVNEPPFTAPCSVSRPFPTAAPPTPRTAPHTHFALARSSTRASS